MTIGTLLGQKLDVRYDMGCSFMDTIFSSTNWFSLLLLQLIADLVAVILKIDAPFGLEDK